MVEIVTAVVPDEAGQFTGDCGYDGLGAFSFATHGVISGAQSFLRSRDALSCKLGGLLRFSLQVSGVARRMPIGPGAYGEDASLCGIASPGDGTGMTACAAAEFIGHQAEVG